MAVQTIIADLQNPSRKTLLQPILEKKGGRYNAQISHMDSAMVNLYTSVNPSRITTDWRGISIELKMDTPPGSARVKSAGKRAEYWRAVSRKRLMQGGLVGLLWQTGTEIQLFFGLISSSSDDLISSVKQDSDSIRLRVKFFDPAINLRVMEWCQSEKKDRRGRQILLIEAPVMYESIRPFLQALQREPTAFPFAQYLVHRREHLAPGQPMTVSPPHYTIDSPNFRWKLGCLFDGAHQALQLDPADLASVEESRDALKTASRLDISQADAMIDCLTKEFCLIQGPPGTGKVKKKKKKPPSNIGFNLLTSWQSFTGVEIMRVLLANGVGRILLIAFTNHALDHLLRSVLDAGITNKIVRLGSRSSDERIAQFSLEHLERISTGSTTNRISINRAYAARKSTEAELNKVLQELQGGPVSGNDRKEYVELYHPGHREELLDPPVWVQQLRQMDAGWTKANTREAQNKRSEYDFWITCQDIRWLQAQLAPRETRQETSVNQFAPLAIEDAGDDEMDDEDALSSDGAESLELESDEDRLRNEFLRQAGLVELPAVPSSNRPLDELLEDTMVWHMSSQERNRLDRSWTEATRQHFLERKKDSFGYLKTKFEDAQIAYEECQSQVRSLPECIRNVVLTCPRLG
jgi:hypothetical protein